MARLFPFRTETETGERPPRVVDIEDEDADAVFSALSSTTAREIYATLDDEPGTASDVADAIDSSIQNVRYHLGNLEEAGLIEVVDTWYSSRGKEMNVYATANGPLIVTGDKSTAERLKAALSRYLGGITLLAGGTAVAYYGLDWLREAWSGSILGGDDDGGGLDSADGDANGDDAANGAENGDANGEESANGDENGDDEENGNESDEANGELDDDGANEEGDEDGTTGEEPDSGRDEEVLDTETDAETGDTTEYADSSEGATGVEGDSTIHEGESTVYEGDLVGDAGSVEFGSGGVENGVSAFGTLGDGTGAAEAVPAVIDAAATAIPPGLLFFLGSLAAAAVTTGSVYWSGR